ncbi:glycosyltransferase family 39 protein [candidate division KSB1 bacterium]|nr:glycosyltransferase family 39 protein [candidate division KSB1 bacterium]
MKQSPLRDIFRIPKSVDYLQYGWWLAIILIIFVRVIHLSMDTPIHHLFTDEGWKLLDARTKTLFGIWNIEPHKPCYLYLHPIFTLLHTLNFKLFGVGYVPARMLNAILGILTIWLIMRIVKTFYDRKAGMIAGLAIGLNYYFSMVQRTAVIEPMVIFFMVVTILLLLNREQSYWYSIGAGVMVVVALATKLYAIILIPTVFVPLIIKRMWRDSLLVATGIGAGFLLYGAAWLIATDFQTFLEVLRTNIGYGELELVRAPAVIQQHDALRVGLAALESVCRRFIYLGHLFHMAPILSVAAAGYFMLFFQRGNSNVPSELEWIVITWLISGLFMLSNSRYTSFHHLLIVLPPLGIAGIIFWVGNSDLVKQSGTSSATGRIFCRSIQYAILWLIIQQIAYALMMMILEPHLMLRTPAIPPIPGFHIWEYLIYQNRLLDINQWWLLPRVQAFELFRHVLTVTSGIIALIITLALSRYKQIRNFRRDVLAVCVILIFVIQTSRFILQIAQADSSEIAASRMLRATLPSGSRVLGGEMFHLENNLHFAHHHEDAAWYIHSADYLILPIYHPLEGAVQNSVTIPNNVRLEYLKTFAVCHHQYNLYKLQHSKISLLY